MSRAHTLSHLESRMASDARGSFIKKTYAHLALAVLALIGVESVLMQSEMAQVMAVKVIQMPYGFLMLLGAFMLVSWVATRFAHNMESKPMQYLGLGLYVVAQAVLFLPLLLIAQVYAGEQVITMAAIMTGLLFAGLTSTVFITGKDFSFLGPILAIGSMVVLGIIVCAYLFGFSLGIVFSAGMVAFAGAAILYDTSKIMRDYPEHAYVGAALQLFASVALLFWYVLQVLMSLGRD